MSQQSSEQSAPLNLVSLITNPELATLSQELVEKTAQILQCDQPLWLGKHIACDFHIDQDTAPLPAEFREELDQNQIDVVFHHAETRRKKALIADMDSTMIQQECIDELAAMAGTIDQVAEITRRAMNGEIEFETSLRERMALLKGLDEAIIDDVMKERITFTPGGKTLVSTMKANGAWCALVSGGFTAFTQRVSEHLGFDENHANTLIIKDGKLAGEVEDPILGREAKVERLNEIASRKSLEIDDFLAVGDGANDLGMLGEAGTGVALHAKPAVAEQADIRIDHGDLTALLYIQGYRQEEFVI